jgi:hypothetical protein
LGGAGTDPRLCCTLDGAGTPIWGCARLTSTRRSEASHSVTTRSVSYAPLAHQQAALARKMCIITEYCAPPLLQPKCVDVDGWQAPLDMRFDQTDRTRPTASEWIARSAPCNMQCATCNMQRATWNLKHTIGPVRVALLHPRNRSAPAPSRGYPFEHSRAGHANLGAHATPRMLHIARTGTA